VIKLEKHVVVWIAYRNVIPILVTRFAGADVLISAHRFTIIDEVAPKLKAMIVPIGEFPC